MGLLNFLAKLQPSGRDERSSIDAGSLDPDDPTIGVRLFDAYLNDLKVALSSPDDRRSPAPVNIVRAASSIGELPGRRMIIAADPRIQAAVVRAAVAWAFPLRSQIGDLGISFTTRYVRLLVDSLFQRKLEYAPEDIDWMLGHIAECAMAWVHLELSAVSYQALLRSIRGSAAGQSLSDAARQSLRQIRDNIVRGYHNAEARGMIELIGEMLGDNSDWLIDSVDDWGYVANQALEALSESEREVWTALLKHAATAKSKAPSERWMSRASKLVAQLGDDRARELILAWLALLDAPTRDVSYYTGGLVPVPSSVVAARNSDVLRGLIWASTSVADDELARALGDAAMQCFKKIPNVGVRSTKAGNACVNALGELATPAAVVQLQRLLQRVKMRSARNLIEEGLYRAATARGLTRDDLEELSTPTFGLVDGVARIEVGDYRAEIAVECGRDATLRWLKPDGRAQKSVPAEVSRDHAAELKAIKGTVKELKTALQQQPWRIEGSYLRDRSWSFAAWRERYVDHPLVSHTARRLIWSFEQGERQAVGGWLDGRIVEANDEPVDWFSDDTVVRLWHPIQASVGEVLAWREWLERHQITQPFKQAHREVYVLTDAELQTETYSNRFAAHILRQHQFNALARERGWQYNLQGGWDGFNVPTLTLPDGLQAQFLVEGVEGDDSAFSHSYVYLSVATDQVCFSRPGQAERILLAEIPPLVFSEVMRDVDLFVGVAGIGADPNWLDGGPGRMAGYQTYWWDVSFGDLTAAARTRRELLERLLPRMAKLEGRWELDERYLKVRGNLRGYKIHLGSGNILMEPNDQYLCIVPGRGAGGGKIGDGLFLPFEGDQTLSVILSKALLLAEDTKINDPTITRQIAAER